jgi:hypothetical protein
LCGGGVLQRNQQRVGSEIMKEARFVENVTADPLRAWHDEVNVWLLKENSARMFGLHTQE